MNFFHRIPLSPDTVFVIRATLLAAVVFALAFRGWRWKLKYYLRREFVRQLKAEATVRRITGEKSTAPACRGNGGDFACLDPMAPRSWMHHIGCPLNAYLRAIEMENASRPAERLRAVPRKPEGGR